jgi:hypothetical protein
MRSKGYSDQEATMPIKQIVEGHLPDQEWRKGCDETHQHYVTTLMEREWMTERVELEVVLRGPIEVNIVDQKDGTEDFPYLSSESPKRDDGEFFQQVKEMIDEALEKWEEEIKPELEGEEVEEILRPDFQEMGDSDLQDLIGEVQKKELPFMIEVPGRIPTIKTEEQRELLIDGLNIAQRVFCSVSVKAGEAYDKLSEIVE